MIRHLLFIAPLIAIQFATQFMIILHSHSQTITQLSGMEHCHDSTIFSVNMDGNAGAAGTLRAGRNGQGENRRILIRFDLSAVPDSSTIVDAALEMFVTDIPGNTTGPTTHFLYRLLQDWVEGDGVNMNGETSSGAATWNSSKDGIETWATPGGLYEPNISAQAVVPAMLQASTVWSDAGMIEDIQSWVNGTISNYGWIIIGDEITPRSIRGFGSSEFSELSPVLHLEYTRQTTHIKDWMLLESE